MREPILVKPRRPRLRSRRTVSGAQPRASATSSSVKSRGRESTRAGGGASFDIASSPEYGGWQHHRRRLSILWLIERTKPQHPFLDAVTLIGRQLAACAQLIADAAPYRFQLLQLFTSEEIER
jgi:hypothetical protein